MRTTMMMALAAVAMVGLGGCMDMPAQRERGLSAHQACEARCNRNDTNCGDSGTGRINPTPELPGTSFCSRDLQECLHRCGDPG